MAADPHRALLVVACVVAAAVGGVALPATEYGGVPGSDVDVAESSDPLAGGFSAPDWDAPLSGNASTPADATPTATPTPTPDGTPDAEETPTPTPTATETATPTQPGTDDDQQDGGLVDLGDEPLIGLGWLPAPPGLGWLATLFWAAVLLVILGAAVAGSAAGISRLPGRSRLPRFGVGERLSGLTDVVLPNPLRSIAARTTASTLSAVPATARLGRALQEAIVGTGSALGSAAAALGRAGRMQASALGTLASAVGGVSLGIPASLSDLTPRFGREDLRSVRSGASATDAADGAGDEASDSGLSVADAWAEMRRLVSISDLSARTPAEIARAAVDQGLPRGPVMRLTDAFRDVTYGRADPDGLRETAALALRSLRDGTGGED